MNNTKRNQSNVNTLILKVLKAAGITSDHTLSTIIDKNTGVKIGKVLLTSVNDAIKYRDMYLLNN